MEGDVGAAAKRGGRAFSGQRTGVALGVHLQFGGDACAGQGRGDRLGALAGAAIGAVSGDVGVGTGAAVGAAVGGTVGAVKGCREDGGCGANSPNRRQYYDERAGRYYYYDSATGRYYWENGTPR